MTHLRRERVDVGELLDGVREYYEASAADGGVSLTTAVASRTGHCRTGPRALAEGGGQPGLECPGTHAARRSGRVGTQWNADSSTIRIEVSDTGVGIPAEALPKVFDRFFRVDSSRSQGSGGTGLGLAIVQSIVQLHGGNVEIASQPGQGTRVTLRIAGLGVKMTKM